LRIIAFMKTSHYRLLRVAIIILGLVYSAVSAVNILSEVAADIPFNGWVLLIRGIILMVIGMVIAIKLRRANEHIFFAFFLVNLALNSLLPFGSPSPIALDLSWALTTASFIYAMITYPGASAGELYSQYFTTTRHPRRYKNAVLYFIAPKHFWLMFFPALIGIRILASLFATIMYGPLNMLGILCGLIYFRISYKLAGKSDRNRLAWVLWGVIVSLLLSFIDILIILFYTEPPAIIQEVLVVLYALTICISLVMAVFFAGFLDSSLVVRRTIVYSAIFVAVIFLFSFIEHYVLYGLSVMLHIEGGMTAAFLAGFLSLAVQPIHKFLEHKLPKF
ncbi:MAG: hypothetical protein ACHQM6_03395, partial [Candidatus Kapaibacterium sp.]